jgi:G:T-mismatch repair DNA endonuclease (very short patch repair protein)
MSTIKQNALQKFLARPDAAEMQARIATLYALGKTRQDISAETGFSYKFLYKLSVHQQLEAGTLKPNTQCGSCNKPLYVVPSKLVHNNFCNKKCIADSLRFAEQPTRVCNNCSKIFPVRSHGIRNKSCSYECSVEFRTNSIERQCETCGKELGPLHPSSTRRFCDRVCSGKSMEVRVMMTCMQCHEEKEMRPSQAAWAIFTCSGKCLLAYRKTNEAYRLQRNANLSAAIKTKWSKEVAWAKAARLRLSKRSSDLMKEWNHNKPSSAEALLISILDEIAFAYDTQHQVQSDMYGCVKCYDFLLPTLNVLVEVHGTYWHADPRKYPDRNKWTHTQRHNRANDEMKATIALVEAKQRLLIVWEEDLVNDRESVKHMFLSLMHRLPQKN